MVIAELGRTRLYRFPGYVRWLQQKSEMTRMIAIEPRTPFVLYVSFTANYEP
jgi:hypothetical protein